MRATQVAVLAAVGARGALSIKSLADSLELERTTLTRNLRPPRGAGLCSDRPGKPSPQQELILTNSGQAALLKALPLWKSPAIFDAAARRSALARGSKSLR